MPEARSLLVAFCCSAVAVCCSAVAAAPVEFNRDVRPILSDKCFTCHGPDASAKNIPFRLDREEAAKGDLGGGRRAIVPGDPAASLIIQRITTTKAAQKMPPVHSGLRLSEAEIATLRTWVEQGASWQGHWAFIPPVRTEVPRGQHPVDYFIQRKLGAKGLKAAGEAGREALIRRVTLDLTGLPPTIAEIDAFRKDRSPDAYERVVDRLLSSPRYGERMAVRWLDAARYADTNGYQFDGERHMWRWRDWVIESFNRNQPFDQFTVEQVAGDLLPNATLSQRIATGFNRNHRANTEDGIVPEEYAVEYVVDRVETASTVFLGLTLGCARCHNHKYDSLTQKEFYQFYAFFNNIPENGRAMKYGNSPPLIPAPTADQQTQLDALLGRIREAESTLEKREAKLRKAQSAWEATIVRDQKRAWWNPASGLDTRNEGNFDIDDHFTLTARVYSDVVPDGSIMSRMKDEPTGKGYGVHADKGKLHINLTSTWESDAIRVESVDAVLQPKTRQHVAVIYDGSVSAAGIQAFVDGQAVKLKVLADNLYRPFRNAGRAFREPFRIGVGWGEGRRFNGRIEDVMLYSRRLSEDEVAAMALDQTVNELAAKPEAQRTKPERLAMRWYFLDHAADADTRTLWARLADLTRQRERLERSFPTVMVMQEKPNPEPTHLLQRGAYDKPGEVVERGVPAVLPSLPQGAPRDRLGLAKWLVDPKNPLTARVAVNRFWQTFFGVGLVKTTEDFGVQGEYPVDPDLLDWLATEFVRSGWNTKAIVRLMVTSAAYRRASQGTPELLQLDPENRYLARGPRHRLAPEMVRDQALAAAGLLTERIGGPSVKPYQPDGLWNEQSMQDMDYVQSKGADLYRRSLYTFWKRTIPPPMMINFDAAQREACVVRETRTNTPLQALNLMNDVTFVEAARFIGQRMMKEGGTDPDARLAYGFRLLTARAPKPEELAVMKQSLQYHKDYFASAPQKAAEWLKQGDSRSDPALPAAELAAYGSVASLMLNLDEVVTKQ